MAEGLSLHCLKSSPAVIAQKATGTAELTGKQNISLKNLGVLRKDVHLNYPELSKYHFVQRVVSLQPQKSA